jgi:hypothetical protein
VAATGMELQISKLIVWKNSESGVFSFRKPDDMYRVWRHRLICDRKCLWDVIVRILEDTCLKQVTLKRRQWRYHPRRRLPVITTVRAPVLTGRHNLYRVVLATDEILPYTF